MMSVRDRAASGVANSPKAQRYVAFAMQTAEELRNQASRLLGGLQELQVRLIGDNEPQEPLSDNDDKRLPEVRELPELQSLLPLLIAVAAKLHAIERVVEKLESI